MTGIILPLLALIGTFYQLYLQRVHNEKSLRPLVQIDLTDHERLLYVHVQNNGVGPYIVERLVFFKDDKTYFNIEDCLDLSPRTYQHISVTETVKKVVPPGMFLQVFSHRFDEKCSDQEINDVRQQLAVLKLKVEGRDIYNNRITAKRELSWFMRHGVSE